jgi:hypothetical protein
MCDQCEVYKQRILVLEKIMRTARNSFELALKEELPREKRQRAKDINWFERMDLFQQANDEFVKAWAVYEKHRKELKKPLTLTTGERLLKMLSSFSMEEQVSSLYTSVDKGWVGCNPKWNGDSDRGTSQEQSGQYLGTQKEVNLEDL